MPITCNIEFDNNPHGIYYAGEVVKGKVTLQTKTMEKLHCKQKQAVTLKILGFAQTDLCPRTDDANSYTGHEDYMQSIIYLMKSDSLSSVSIKPGIYSYNFECQIPITCPSSFENLYGHIRYTVTVTIEHRWKFNDTYTRNFTVWNFVDSNYINPVLYNLTTVEKCKTFGFGLRNTGPLKINVSIPQSIYVPGQIIPINVLIKNRSNVRAEEIGCTLVMHICYYSQTPRKETRKQQIKVIKSIGEGVPPNCLKNVKNELRIPATPPTCLNLCSIIKVTYELKVKVKFKGFHANEVLCIPITIGMQQQPGVNPSSSGGPVVQPSVFPQSEPKSLKYVNDIRYLDND